MGDICNQARGKMDFTEVEKSLITAICSLYNIQIRSFRDGVFKGIVPKNARITLNGTYLSQLSNSSNVLYIELRAGVIELTIIAQ